MNDISITLTLDEWEEILLALDMAQDEFYTGNIDKFVRSRNAKFADLLRNLRRQVQR